VGGRVGLPHQGRLRQWAPAELSQMAAAQRRMVLRSASPAACNPATHSSHPLEQADVRTGATKCSPPKKGELARDVPISDMGQRLQLIGCWRRHSIRASGAGACNGRILFATVCTQLLSFYILFYTLF
jgi:hypothetical protein